MVVPPIILAFEPKMVNACLFRVCFWIHAQPQTNEIYVSNWEKLPSEGHLSYQGGGVNILIAK